MNDRTSATLPAPVNFSDVQIPGNDEFNKRHAVWGHTTEQVTALSCDYEAVIDSLQAELDARLERLQYQVKITAQLHAEVEALRAELANERQAAWEAVNKWIKQGPLPGNGCDEQAQRNGMILAANLLHERLTTQPKD